MQILLTGATGLVGTALIPHLQAAGHTVIRLLRRLPDPGSPDLQWDPSVGTIDTRRLSALADGAGIDAVIHLAGENVGEGRWTEARRREILGSRTRSTGLLASSLAALRRPPQVLISASAVGWYGDAGDRLCTEDSPPGSGFLSAVCRAWEEAAEPARAAGIRVVHPRIGVVLTKRGGALPRMAMPFRFGVGGPVGSGRQYIAWLSMPDLLRALTFLLTAPMEGPVNLCAPAAATGQELAAAIGRALSRPSLIPVPAFAIRALFGQMGQEVLLEGARVDPQRLRLAGFQFQDGSIGELLRQELA